MAAAARCAAMTWTSFRRRWVESRARSSQYRNMAATLVPPESSTEGLPRKRFTREDLEQMLEAGLFAGQRYELIDGDLINKMGQGSRHAYGIRLCGNWLSSVFEPRRVQVQLPVEAAEDERALSLPEPDVAVLAEWKTKYQDRHPYGHEMLLAIEVADRTA